MKILKTVLISILLSLLLFHVVDYCASLNCWQCTLLYRKLYMRYNGTKLQIYLKYYDRMHNYSIKSDKHIDECFDNLIGDEYAKKGEDNLDKFRPIENESAQKSILLFGCSYCYGLNLNDNETFSAKLGRLLSNYKIYNRAKLGWTTSHMLYQLENKDFSKIPNVELVVYLFMNDHLARDNYSCTSIYTPYYMYKNDDIIEFQKYSLKYIDTPISYLLKNYKGKLFFENLYGANNKNKKNGILKKINLTKKIIEKSKSEVDIKFPNAKFIVLRYDCGKKEPYNYMFEELKKEGIVVVSFSDLSNNDYTNIKYRLPNDIWHPNSRVWKEITPLFVKYLKDNKYLND